MRPPVPRGLPRGFGFAFPAVELDAARRSTAALARCSATRAFSAFLSCLGSSVRVEKSFSTTSSGVPHPCPFLARHFSLSRALALAWAARRRAESSGDSSLAGRLDCFFPANAL
jgi:hypothetical protein